MLTIGVWLPLRRYGVFAVGGPVPKNKVLVQVPSQLMMYQWGCLTDLPGALARRGRPQHPHPFRGPAPALRHGGAAAWSARIAEAFRTEKHHARLQRKSDPHVFPKRSIDRSIAIFPRL